MSEDDKAKWRQHLQQAIQEYKEKDEKSEDENDEGWFQMYEADGTVLPIIKCTKCDCPFSIMGRKRERVPKGAIVDYLKAHKLECKSVYEEKANERCTTLANDTDNVVKFRKSEIIIAYFFLLFCCVIAFCYVHIHVCEYVCSVLFHIMLYIYIYIYIYACMCDALMLAFCDF